MEEWGENNVFNKVTMVGHFKLFFSVNILNFFESWQHINNCNVITDYRLV